ncbi:MAG TPA: hypothetical protein VMF52_21220 [Steroidobacteraceae bacterium]|nr:hypothetical protein [Steroidobacteraceae bacterium]
MRHSINGLALTGLAALVLSACGSSGGGEGNGDSVITRPTVTLTASPTAVASGSSTTLTWNSNRATDCTASGGWTGAKAVSGTEVISNITAATTYTITCAGVGGTSNPASAAVTISGVAAATAANAGPDVQAYSGATVRLSGEASVDPQGDPLTFAWTQTGGTAVTLTGANTATPTFVAPAVTADTVLTFSLIVNDGTAASAPSTVRVTVQAPAAGNVLLTGRITFARVKFNTTLNLGLDYTNQVNQPARAIFVEARAAGTATVLASNRTDSDGNYVLTVPANTSVDVVAIARMTRLTPQPLPRWDFTVVDKDHTPNSPYEFKDAPVNSATGATHDMNIPSGFGATRTPTGVRASGPFAVLDTVYAAVQGVLSAAPTTDFPALKLDWAEDNEGGNTFFDSASQTIVLSADPDDDSDEFDPHVIAHEFGHYIEDNFSRADNIGGAHGLGDKLDIRVAFGEGFGYAFAAIVLKDPVARDSFVSGGVQVSSTFNVETNPSTSAPGTTSGNYGCWCSESSVWSILWDLYDGAADTNDTVALGFRPMWDVLVNQQRSTTAMTSIFSFVTAVKSTQPDSVGAINTLVNAQNITSGTMDAFATTETHFPTEVASAGALPVYTTLTAGTPVTVRSVNDAGTYNALGNHRFVRYVKSSATSQTVTISTAANLDADAIVYRNGTFVSQEEDIGNESFTITTAGTYIFDVYEYSNYDDTSGTPGDYDITVAVN